MYAPPIPVPAARSVSHTVKLGETLPGIAQRHKVSVEDLRRWNRIGRLATGQKLTVQTRGSAPKGKTAAKVKAKPVNVKAKPRSLRPSKSVTRS